VHVSNTPVLPESHFAVVFPQRLILVFVARLDAPNEEVSLIFRIYSIVSRTKWCLKINVMQTVLEHRRAQSLKHFRILARFAFN